MWLRTVQRRALAWNERHPYRGDLAFAALLGVVIAVTGWGPRNDPGIAEGIAVFVGVSVALVGHTAWERRRRRQR